MWLFWFENHFIAGLDIGGGSLGNDVVALYDQQTFQYDPADAQTSPNCFIEFKLDHYF